MAAASVHAAECQTCFADKRGVNRQRCVVDGVLPDERSIGAEFGLQLHRRRTELGLTQETVAFAAGISRTYYGSLEKGVNDRGRGDPANPTMMTLIRLATALNCSVGDLVDIQAKHLVECRQ